MDEQLRKILVLSSGGLDSTTALAAALANRSKDEVATVSIFYGQRHSKELKCAQDVADYYGVKHYELDLSNILQYSDCSLLESSSNEIPEMSYADQIEQNGEGKVSTYVPFRNGLMLSAVASLAQSIYPEDRCWIYIGAHADDAAGDAYADCSVNFVHAMDRAINIGTYGKVGIVAPFVKYNKSKVVERGLELSVPYQLTWSCYKGGDKACGKCGTCIDRLAAFEANSAKDPIEYED